MPDAFARPANMQQNATMNALLKKAIEAAAKLPDDEQTALARAILDRLDADDDARWDASFADPGSAALLKRLADEADDNIVRRDVMDGDPSSITR